MCKIYFIKNYYYLNLNYCEKIFEYIKLCLKNKYDNLYYKKLFEYIALKIFYNNNIEIGSMRMFTQEDINNINKILKYMHMRMHIINKYK